MAENKKTFVFYSDWRNMIQEMPNEDAGELLKHILGYVNDENPTTDNILVKMAFGHMKPLLKSDLVKWEKQLKTYSKMGKESAKKRALNKVEPKPTYVEPASTVNENVNVNDNVNETAIDIHKKSKPKKVHLFSESEFIDADLFRKKIQEDEKYLCFDFNYYHEAVLQWSNQGNKKKDWIATAKGFMLRDQKPRLNEEFKNVQNNESDAVRQFSNIQ